MPQGDKTYTSPSTHFQRIPFARISSRMITKAPSSLDQRSEGKGILQTVLYVGLMLPLFALSGVVIFRYTIHHVERITRASSTVSSRCPYPIVYNKPHKTASTRIQIDLLKWAASQKRPAYSCSPFINQATVQMRECVPQDSSGCAVLATHIVLSPVMRRIIEEKIGRFLLVTSTRKPSARIVSFYLQDRRKKASSKLNVTDLKDWLKAFNPWEMYNYHTGNNRRGICPMSVEEKMLLPDLVNQADIVVDADLREVSNTILKKKGLFKMSAKKTNVRSSKDLVLDEDTKNLLRNVTCVEDEIHRLYRLRMASLYETATGKKCLSNTRHPIPCFEADKMSR